MTLRTQIDARYVDLLNRFQPFLVSLPEHLSHYDLAPMGEAVAADHLYDPTRLSSDRFLDDLQILDRHSFGPKGMPMPKWVFYQSAE